MYKKNAFVTNRHQIDIKILTPFSGQFYKTFASLKVIIKSDKVFCFENISPDFSDSTPLFPKTFRFRGVAPTYNTKVNSFISH